MSDASGGSTNAPRWRPLGYQERRVLGVLIEKAKTTPDVYPLTVNGLVTGCNQKSNRDPVFNVEPEQVEDSLEKLRQLGVVAEVQGSGRVPKYRHYAYEWLGVEKVELGVMCELLLRGEQTEGELRGRVSRMDPINDLPTLREVLKGLQAKGLVVPLTPEGRGRVVAHTLFLPQELDKLRAKYANHVVESDFDEPAAPAARATPERSATPPAPVDAGPRVDPAEVASLREEVTAAREAIAQLRSDYQALAARLEATEASFKQLRDALGG